ncbi:hypothetical protein [uncultured Amnibacterium sp.]|uniref:hypothetical protein n=1 Tax=uncultured Amnibacterium sp. TaxID=1631851 RepID=UPI0035C9674A
MDDLASEAQVDRMAGQVLRRIEQRRAQRRAGATVAVTAVLLVGGFGLLLTQFGHGASIAASSGSGAGSTAERTSLVECHGSSLRTSSFRTVQLQGAATARSAVAACAEQSDEPRNQPAPSELSAAGARDLVACRDDAGRLQVFVKDSRPATLCARNGMEQP